MKPALLLRKSLFHLNSASPLTKHTECSDVRPTLTRGVLAEAWNSVPDTRTVLVLDLLSFLTYASHHTHPLW